MGRGVGRAWRGGRRATVRFDLVDCVLMMMFDLRSAGRSEVRPRRGRRRRCASSSALAADSPRARRREERAFVPLDGVVPEDGDGGGQRAVVPVHHREELRVVGVRTFRVAGDEFARQERADVDEKVPAHLRFELEPQRDAREHRAHGNQRPGERVRPGPSGGIVEVERKGGDRLGDDDVEFEGCAVSFGSRKVRARKAPRRV